MNECPFYPMDIHATQSLGINSFHETPGIVIWITNSTNSTSQIPNCQQLIVLVEQWHDFFTVLFQVCAALQKAHAELASLHQPLKGYGLNLGCFNSGCRIQAGSVGRVLRTRVTEKQKMRDIKTHCLFSEHL